MKLFDLPSKEKRKPSESIFQMGNPFKKYCAEPDYYIIYSAGYWARWYAILISVATFLIIISYHKYGYFTGFISGLGVSTNYDIFVKVIDFMGFPALFIFLYHFLWFRKAIGIGKVDILRPIDSQNGISESMRNQVFFACIIGFVGSVGVTIFPSVAVSIFHESGMYGYKYIPNGVSEDYANNLGFIFVLSLIVVVTHGFFSSSILTTAIIIASRKRKHSVDDKGDE